MLLCISVSIKNECCKGLSKIGNGKKKPSLILCVDETTHGYGICPALGIRGQSLGQKLWRPVLVKINIIKWHHKSLFWPVQYLLWTHCIFLSSLHRPFFSVLLIFFSYMNYFLLRLVTFLYGCMNEFFMRTTNHFLVVLQIIFNTSIENYFFIVLIIIFCSIINLFLGLQYTAGLRWWGDWLKCLPAL